MTILLLIKILGTIVIAAACGWAWRFGGSAHGIRWVREFGTGVAYIACMTLWFSWSWWVILLMGLSFAESTYFKAKGSEAKWYNWLLCGILYSLVPIPLVICHVVPLEGFILRFLVLTPIITLWRTFQGNVQWSESGVGVWQIITIPLMMIKL